MPADRKHLVRPRWFSTSSTATTNSSSPMLLGWQSAVVSMGNLCFNIAISNKFNWRLLLKQRWCNQPLSSTVRNIHPVSYISHWLKDATYQWETNITLTYIKYAPQPSNFTRLVPTFVCSGKNTIVLQNTDNQLKNIHISTKVYEYMQPTRPQNIRMYYAGSNSVVQRVKNTLVLGSEWKIC